MVRKLFILGLFLPMVGSLLPSAAVAEKPNSADARNAGDIRGTVENCSGTPNMILVYQPGTSWDARTDEVGNFKMSYVQVGTHDLVFVKQGQRLGSLPGVEVVDSQTTELGVIRVCPDADGDGFDQSEDCDDGNSSIHPGADETCDDGVDNDCDGQADEGCVVCTDFDLDTFFAQANCNTAIDCDDTNPAIHPNAVEVCDGVDNNCDGQTDTGAFCDDGNACTIDVCVNGVCLGELFIDFETDPLNCGGCGIECDLDQICVFGACVQG